MSPEALLAVGASPAPSPSTPAAAPLAAGGAAGSSAGGADTGSGAASGAGTGSSPLGGASRRAGQSSSAQHGRTGESGKTHKRSAASTGSREAHPAKSGKGNAQGVKNFSQTLAQSLADPAHNGARPTVARTDKPAKAPAAHRADTPHKSDPVSAAMAMMSPAVPAAPAQPVAHGVAAKRSDPAQAARIDPAGGKTRNDPRTVLQAGMLAQATDKADPASHGAPSQGLNSASVGAANSAAALSAGQLAAGTHAAAAAPAGMVSAALSAPVGSNGWTGQLGAQLTWMVRQGVQSASLQVSPQHLGPVQVSISVHHGQASVWFGAAQAETRQALTQALPELRAMFAHQGLALTDSGVSHEPPRDSRRPARPAVAAIGEVGASEDGTLAAGGPAGGIGLIDAYA